MYATIGIHPHEAKLAQESDFQELEQLAKRPKVIAVGEIGLDYYYDHSPRDVQKHVFLKQMELAKSGETADCDPLPSIRGQRECLGRLSRDDRERWAPSGLGGICIALPVHWRMPRKALDLGFMISFAEM